MWFTREEQSVLTSLWYCQMGVSVMVSVDSKIALYTKLTRGFLDSSEASLPTALPTTAEN